jgi:hypothetical protein
MRCRAGQGDVDVPGIFNRPDHAGVEQCQCHRFLGDGTVPIPFGGLQAGVAIDLPNAASDRENLFVPVDVLPTEAK